MAEEDYEIDYYGDAGNDQQQHSSGSDQQHHANGDRAGAHHEQAHDDHDRDQEQSKNPQAYDQGDDGQGSVDPNATTALMISELNWWTTDDDIRGWLRQGGCEAGVKDMSFSEHKVNGKSKGQIYLEFNSAHDATSAKHLIDKMPADGGHLGQKKISTQYWNPNMNPFRTLPKDAPARGKDQPRSAQPGSYSDRGNYNSGGGFRGRGGYGGGRGNMGQNSYNRNFGGGGGYNNNMGGGGGFGMGGGGGNFAFNAGRGNMMGGGMRGGGMRGGRGGNMMGMNPMGGMNMGMPGAMGMGMMGATGMPGFQGIPGNFNNFGGFGQNQGGGGGDWGNPHGAKRPRPE
ncbi:RRM domain protein [Emericellopsis cladophorae]|uniref:RRM domain protein n=1 Tax=Emericellopsis cladophorae TaxID=2686198 RepID=A0A9Q0BCA6_9HYPO|nr:RRM domain protein [Emericellopsis cladophorae]KAI6778909.1 RRM domain protein [Emericellopsis cladophorae]